MKFISDNAVLYVLGVIFLGLGVALYQGTGSFFIILGVGVACLSIVRTLSQKVP